MKPTQTAAGRIMVL